MKRTHNGTRIDYDGIGEIRKSLESRRLEKERDVTSRYVLVISVLNSANSKQAPHHHIYIYLNRFFRYVKRIIYHLFISP